MHLPSGGGFDERLIPDASDQEPQDDRGFSEKNGKCDPRNDAPVLRQKEGGEALDRVGEAVRDQQDSKDAGNEARFVYENPERQKPKTPEDLGDEQSIAMQAEEDHRQGIQLRLRE